MSDLVGLKMEGQFPVFIEPMPKITLQDIPSLLKQNEYQISQLLLTHGALLFRNFPVDEPRHFADFIQHLALGDFVHYIGGDSPRDIVENKVYTSTEAPPSLHIPLHQELSFIKKFPRHIYFFCEIEPDEGGETIIADARKVYAALDNEVKESFKQHGLTYTSRYYYKSKLMNMVNRLQRSHKSWREVFETDNKSEVEKHCLENEFDWQWLANDWIQIQQTRPATLLHPHSNEIVWFNQAHLYDFNPKLLGWKRYLGAKLFYFRRSTRLHEIEFADGSPIPKKYLYHILEVLNAQTVKFPWKQRDVLLLDNILAMHGRAPFHGKRRILTSLTS